MRQLFVMFLCLMLGLALSVVIAWVCIQWAPAGSGWVQYKISEKNPLAKKLTDHGDFDSFVLETGSGFGFRDEFMHGWDTKSRYKKAPDKRNSHLRRVRAGWPALCLEGVELNLFGEKSLQGAVRAKNKRSMLPFQPRWSKLLVNGAFYGWILYAVGVLLRSTFFWNRRRRGRCEHCGYDLRGLPGANSHCPECGNSIPVTIQPYATALGGVV